MFLIILTCITISSTVARYTTTKSGTGEANVAKWSFKVNELDGTYPETPTETENKTGSTETGEYYYGATITLTATANAGYKWSKWTSSNTELVANITTANTTFTMPAGVITMTPSASTIRYEIEYNLKGRTVTKTNPTNYTVTTNEITLNNPTKTGYTFSGWNTETDGTGTSYTDSEEVTNLTSTNNATVNLYAQWEHAEGVYVRLYEGGTLAFSKYIDDTIEGKTLSKDYGNIKNTIYNSDSLPSWYNDRKSITEVTIINEIKPNSTAFWFQELSKLSAIDNIEYLNTSSVTDMSYMFAYDNKLESIYVGENWSISETNTDMFLACNGQLIQLNYI